METDDRQREDFDLQREYDDGPDPDEYDEAFTCACGKLERLPDLAPYCHACREDWGADEVADSEPDAAPCDDDDDPLAFDRERERRFFG